MPMAPGVYAPPAQLGEGGGTEGGLPGPAAPVTLPPAQPLPAPDFIQQQPLVEDGPGSSMEAVGVGKEIVSSRTPKRQFICINRNLQHRQHQTQSARAMAVCPMSNLCRAPGLRFRRILFMAR